MNNFFKNTACPIGCEYCMVTKIDARSTKWKKQHRYGLNKTLLFVNKFPDEKEFIYNKEFIQDEFVGFEGISDPFWNVYHPFLFEFLQSANVSKKIILVTKWKLDQDIISKILQFKNLVIAISITGLDKFNIEKTSTKDRIYNLELLMNNNIPTIPLIHPYISGLCDLSFLNDIASLGIKEVSVKGFRFNKKNMPIIANKLKNPLYFENQENEILVNDFNDSLSRFGINNISFRSWAHRNNVGYKKSNRTISEIEGTVNKLLKEVVISSSESNFNEIRRIAIERRL